MAYLVLARKYRPQTFSEVVSQEHVVKTLVNSISSGRVAHANLFSGPRGTGKTTIARLLAKAMNCETAPTTEPCNKCRSCIEITAGNASDVYEIDGASNNGVDQIRELRDNSKYLPVHSPYKIYIIDEVHMLSIQAFNALLKTLEEPPPHIMFLFATTEPKKIPITILSRCRRHDFRRIDFEAIKKHMKSLCERENVNIDDEALNLITGESGGSIRDSLSLLDHVITCSEDHVTAEKVVNILGLIDRKHLFDISKSILEGNPLTVLEQIDEIYDMGHDLKDFYGDLIAHFRNLMMVKVAKKIEKLVDLPSSEVEMMKQQVQSYSEIHISRILNQLFKEESAVKFSSFPRAAVETIALRLLQLKPVLLIETLIEKVDELRQTIKTSPSGFVQVSQKTQASVLPEHRPTVETGSQPKEPYKLSPPHSPEIRDASDSTDSKPGLTKSYEPPSVVSFDGDSLWRRILESLPQTSGALKSVLEKCEPAVLNDNRLEIKVSGTKFDSGRVEKNKTVIRDICRTLLGKETEIVIIGDSKKSSSVSQKKDISEKKQQDALNHPLVEKALDIFKGKIVDIKSL